MALVQSPSLSEQINDLLLARITSSELKSGQRLKESEIARELGVSRTPVREALMRLAASGFVRRIPRSGVFVREIDTRTLEEVLAVRSVLELYAAEGGVERISEQQVREMRSLVKRSEAIVVGSDRAAYNEYVRSDCDLHRIIVSASGNKVLNESYERLAVFLYIARVRFFEPNPSMAEGHEEHRTIVAAYEATDREVLLRALGGHLRRASKEILEVARRMTFGVTTESPV